MGPALASCACAGCCGTGTSTGSTICKPPAVPRTTSACFRARARPEWSGIAPGCSHPDRDPERDRIHDIDRQHGQLRQAGIADIPPADLSWCRGDIARFALPRRFALLVPGSAPHRPVKRWPAAHYRVLAAWLIRQGITPVVIGTAAEHALADEICAAVTPGSGAHDPAAAGACGTTRRQKELARAT